MTVNWATAAGGTATAATDYQSASGVVTFAPGETLKQVPVTVLGDNLNELNETVVVALTNPVSTTIGTANGTGVITDDDPKPAASISDATIFEGNSGQSNLTFTVNLSAASGRDVTLAWTTKDGTATVANSDYVAGSGTLSFAAGETSKTITVLVNGDHNVEADETFTVLLSSPVNVTLADASGLGTILNDD